MAVFNVDEEKINYRDLYNDPPEPGSVPNCAEAGVIATLPGILGTMQANECIKLISRVGEPLIGKMLVLDTSDNSSRTIRIKPSNDNPLRNGSMLYYGEEICEINNAEIDKKTLEQWQIENPNLVLIDVREASGT